MTRGALLVVCLSGCAAATPVASPSPSVGARAPTIATAVESSVASPVEAPVETTATLVDLCDDWAPLLYSPEGTPPEHRAVLVALAAERFDDPGVGRWAAADRYLEPFGIAPDFAVLARRLDEADRHACHGRIDDRALVDDARPFLPDRRTPRAERDAARAAAIRVVQEHLVCEGLRDASAVDGVFEPAMRDALWLYQRKHGLIGDGTIDATTRAAMLTDPRELDFRAVLRSLRERVVDATGLVEDGSAIGAPEPVLGRDLDPSAVRRAGLDVGAPDLVARATQAAAIALGWTDVDAARAGLAALAPGSCRVTLPLPPLPTYHGPDMALEAEIDPGDVWYQYPWTPKGQPRSQPVERRPTLTVFAVHDGQRTALMRWPTTIGGWQREQRPSGRVVLRYKPSSPGAFVWRDVVAAPAWFAPPSTPDHDLVRRLPGGRVELREDLIGPGYRSAYGLAMLVHEVEDRRPTPKPKGKAGAETDDGYADRGIRTHGSVAYTSVAAGHSHGCHRLPNAAAVRLAGFVLRHRPHDVRGPTHEHYDRKVKGAGKHHLRRTTRGFVYRLRTPMPVTVLPPHVLGPVTEPPEGAFPLPPRRPRR